MMGREATAAWYSAIVVVVYPADSAALTISRFPFLFYANQRLCPFSHLPSLLNRRHLSENLIQKEAFVEKD